MIKLTLSFFHHDNSKPNQEVHTSRSSITQKIFSQIIYNVNFGSQKIRKGNLMGYDNFDNKNIFLIEIQKLKKD